ncbi:MAG: hydroxyphenylacetyl-CoA thioesterase PaaI [Acidimicrobiia bacterium]|nr:MAG: hydroxyphenylacetyl-CoA thioesterase PaaI [Acidimicrobiia bacterium]
MDRITTITTAFEGDTYANALGFTLGRVTEYSVVVSMTVREDHLNFHGVLHGGALFSLADCAFSLASNAHGDTAMAIDTHLALTASSKLGDTLTAAAIEITRGRSLATYRVNVTRPNDRMVGLFTGTVFIQTEDRTQ